MKSMMDIVDNLQMTKRDDVSEDNTNPEKHSTSEKNLNGNLVDGSKNSGEDTSIQTKKVNASISTDPKLGIPKIVQLRVQDHEQSKKELKILKRIDVKFTENKNQVECLDKSEKLLGKDNNMILDAEQCLPKTNLVNKDKGNILLMNLDNGRLESKNKLEEPDHETNNKISIKAPLNTIESLFEIAMEKSDSKNDGIKIVQDTDLKNEAIFINSDNDHSNNIEDSKLEHSMLGLQKCIDSLFAESIESASKCEKNNNVNKNDNKSDKGTEQKIEKKANGTENQINNVEDKECNTKDNTDAKTSEVNKDANNNSTQAMKTSQLEKNKKRKNKKEDPKKEKNAKDYNMWICVDPGCRVKNNLSVSKCTKCNLPRAFSSKYKTEYKPNYEKVKRRNQFSNWIETNCWLTFMESPFELYIQNSKQKNDFSYLNMKLNDQLNRTRRRAMHIELNTQIYTVNHDSSWWRVIVKGCDNNWNCQVQFIDHGSMEYFNKRDIFMIDDNMQRISPLTTRYHLHYLQASGPNLYKSAYEYVLDSCAHKKLTLDVTSVENDKNIKTLFADVFTEVDYVNYNLMCKGLASVNKEMYVKEMTRKYNQFMRANMKEQCESMNNNYQNYNNYPATPWVLNDIPNPSPTSSNGSRSYEDLNNYGPVYSTNNSYDNMKTYEQVIDCYKGKIQAYEDTLTQYKRNETTEMLTNACDLFCGVLKRRNLVENLSENVSISLCLPILEDLSNLHKLLDEKIDHANALHKRVSTKELSSRSLQNLISDKDEFKIKSTKVAVEMIIIELGKCDEERDPFQCTELRPTNCLKLSDFLSWQTKYESSKKNVDAAAKKVSETYMKIGEGIKSMIESKDLPYFPSVLDPIKKFNEAINVERDLLSKNSKKKEIIKMLKFEFNKLFKKITHVEALINTLVSSINCADSLEDLCLEEEKLPQNPSYEVKNTLLDYIIRSSVQPTYVKVILIKDIFADLKALHERNIAYRYLNPQNITIDCQGCASLIMKEHKVSYEPIPPWNFHAPENKDDKVLNKLPADIYSLGKIIIWMFSLVEEENRLDRMMNVEKYFMPVLPLINNHPKLRPTIHDLKIEELLESIVNVRGSNEQIDEPVNVPDGIIDNGSNHDSYSLPLDSSFADDDELMSQLKECCDQQLNDVLNIEEPKSKKD